MNLGTLMPRHARYRGDHTAVVFGEQRLSYGQFNARINQVANMLRELGVAQGDRVAVILPNRLELLELYWACAALGAIVVPLSPLLNVPGLRTLLSDSDPKVVVSHQGMVQALSALRHDLPRREMRDPNWRHTLLVDGDAEGEADFRSYHRLSEAASAEQPPAVHLRGEELFNICYSSGTTGLPKGITHSHDVRGNYGSQFASAFRMTPESVVLHTGSIVFNGAFVTLMPTFFLGATYILGAVFDPEDFIETVARERVTHVMLVPSQIIAILNSPNFSTEKLESLEMVLSLGAPLHKVHKDELDRRLPGRFYELYGLTEGFVTVLDKYDFHRKPTAVGSPLPLFEMRICDDDGKDVPVGEVGEIVGRGPILMPGYYNRPDLTEKAIRDGWLFSGDLGYVDEDGYLYLVDRKKDMIISGGVNVYPKDIEEVVQEHPAVLENAVFGAEDPKWGETPVAAVVLKDGQALEVQELISWVNERVSAKYQRLSDVLILKEMPRNVAGKTLKRELREQYERGRAA